MVYRSSYVSPPLTGKSRVLSKWSFKMNLNPNYSHCHLLQFFKYDDYQLQIINGLIYWKFGKSIKQNSKMKHIFV